MSVLYLVRHGQASFGAADYDQPSERGLQQARRLGDWLARGGNQFRTVVVGGMRLHRRDTDGRRVVQQEAEMDAIVVADDVLYVRESLF